MLSTINRSEGDNDLIVTVVQETNHQLDHEKATFSTVNGKPSSPCLDPSSKSTSSNAAAERACYDMVDDTKSAVEEPPTRDPFLDDIPNGGYGWVVVVACFFATFTLFGIANVWGIFSQAYSTSILEGKATTLQLMTIGSLLNVSINVFTPVSVLLVRYGVRLNYAVGSVLMCLGAIIASFSTELWHLYLTQGLLFGFGGSFLYMSVMSVIPQWFTTRRATAMGFSTSGAGLGGLAVSPMANYLIAKYGIPWAYRIIGFYTLGVCAVGAILIKDRLPRSYLKKRPIESPIQLSMFKDVNFDIWLVGSVIGLTGYLGPIFYLPKYAVSIGLSETDASNLLSVLLAMTAVTRLTLGFVADRIGRLNMFIICSALSGLFSFVIWTFATSYGVLLAFCILWGGTCGMYYPLASPITASVVGLKRLPSGLSIVFIFSAISAMGTPISAAIQQATPNNGYLGVQMFTGAVYVCGALICLYLKYRLTRSLWSKF